MPQKFKAKLLLFGEYGLMFDAMALSVPYPRFSGFLDFDSEHLHPESSSEILKFYVHLKSGETHQKLNFPLDLNRLEADIRNGLYFNSTIPQQYGVGSSGALVASLFAKYSLQNNQRTDLSPDLLKADFALLESYFHGKSSGLDPLISYLNKSVLADVRKSAQIIDFELHTSGLSIALIDTKITGATGPLVQYFVDRLNDPKFKRTFESEFIPANNSCIKSLLENRMIDFFEALEILIRYELVHFTRMFPSNFHEIVEDALIDKVYIKLLGSGGGGFLLAFAEQENLLHAWSEKNGIILEKVV